LTILKNIFKNPSFEIEAKLGYVFKNKKLLKLAITHKSAASRRDESYERLEFLGDSVLQLIITEFIYKRFPTKTEGELTKYRSAIVNKYNLYIICKKLSLINYLMVNHNVDLEKESTLVNLSNSLLEAIIGAIYIDGGFKKVREFINKKIIQNIDLDDILDSFNIKGKLIEICHQRGIKKVKFRTISKGPDHDKTFKSVVYINNKEIGTGTGKTKKFAEENAAKMAFKEIKKLSD